MKRFALLLLFLLALPLVAFAQQTTNTYETEVSLTYFGWVDTVGVTSTYSDDFLMAPIAGLNNVIVTAVATDETGTEDVDISIECSADLTQYFTSSTPLLTQVTATAQADTLAAPHLYALALPYCRLLIAGQSGNPSDSDIYWSISGSKGASTGSRRIGRTQ